MARSTLLSLSSRRAGQEITRLPLDSGRGVRVGNRMPPYAQYRPDSEVVHRYTPVSDLHGKVLGAPQSPARAPRDLSLTSRAGEWVNRMRMSHGHVNKLNRCWSLFVPLSLLRSASAASSRDDVDHLCVAS